MSGTLAWMAGDIAMRLLFTNRWARIVVSGGLIAFTSPLTAAAEQPRRCQPSAALVRVPELPEGSGLAASRRTPGRFWSHNDSGDAVLFALDGTGHVNGRVSLAGANVEDWEAIAIGPCPSGSCIYLADIGDNDARRKRITIYRVAEPAEASGSIQATDVFYAT